MKKEPQYIRDTGFLVDLLFIYVIHFNPDSLAMFINEFKYDEDLTFYKKIEEKFAPYNDAFLPFFYCKNEGISFSTMKFIHDDNFFCDFSFEDMKDAFSDVHGIKIELYDFYFGIKVQDISIAEVSQEVINSTLSNDLKLQLLFFYSNPESVLQHLIDDMERLKNLLNRYYEENMLVLANAKKIHWTRLSSNLKNNSRKSIDMKNADYIEYSICLIRKNYIFINTQYSLRFVLLGYDHESFMDYILAKEQDFNIQTFCNALSDSHRFHIFGALLESDELSTSEIAEVVGLSVTALLYHLDVMMKSGILAVRTEGRKVIYHVNTYAVEQAGKHFMELAGSKRGGVLNEKVV